ncbi:MAG TPA: hypothetical protein VIY27_07270 [Myxococcota bacterium]
MSLKILGCLSLGLLLATVVPPALALDPETPAYAGESEPLPALPTALQTVRDEDRGALEVLSLYQDPLRAALLEVARRPQALIALESAQAETRKAFQELIAPLPEQERAQIWELVRYPELIEALVEAKPKGQREVDELTREHPEEIRDAARFASREHSALLLEIHRLQSGFEASFEALVHGLDAEGGAAFRTALAHPEMLEILTAHMHLSVLLGEIYGRDPQGLERALTSLANDVAGRTASAREDWIRSLEEDPEAQAELEQAAEAYAEAEGIDYAEETGSRGDTRLALVVSPYPYWFGFPGAYFGFSYGFYPYAGYWWYPYPYAHHHHFGFYYGPRHRVVVYGFPSHFFLSWYFGAGAPHERYPHLSGHFGRHRVAHHYSHDRVSHHVERWGRLSQPREERMRGGESRVASLREFGRQRRAGRTQAYGRPENPRRWDWLLGAGDRSRSERRVRDAELNDLGARDRADRSFDRPRDRTRGARPDVRERTDRTRRERSISGDRRRDSSDRQARRAEPNPRPRAREHNRPSFEKPRRSPAALDRGPSAASPRSPARRPKLNIDRARRGGPSAMERAGPNSSQRGGSRPRARRPQRHEH